MESSFLNRSWLVGAEISSARYIVEETLQLSIKMCIADTIHDKTVNENVHRLQRVIGDLLEQLSSEIMGITDHASIEKCLLLCSQAIKEVQADVLTVETERVVKSEFSNKSTVNPPSFFDKSSKNLKYDFLKGVDLDGEGGNEGGRLRDIDRDREETANRRIDRHLGTLPALAHLE